MQQPEQRNEELPTVQPDLVYAHIVPSQEPDSRTNQLYANAPANTDREMHDPVLYSELLSKDNAGDVYSQVQKR